MRWDRNHSIEYLIYLPKIYVTMINRRLTEAFFATHLPKGGGYHPSLDFGCKASDFYDFGTRG